VNRSHKYSRHLGFDIRVGSVQHQAEWSLSRRSDFLIRPEILAPISVDDMVWPRLGPDSSEFPMWLWGSTGEILSAFPALGGSTIGDSGRIIAIGTLTDDERYAKFIADVFFGYKNAASYEIVNSKQELLGFDVADRFFISGLSNCKLALDELTAIRSDWSHAIRESGLIRDPDLARTFCVICDKLIPEHAPFEVYQIDAVEVLPTATGASPPF
jgi:hypothetical protein